MHIDVREADRHPQGAPLHPADARPPTRVKRGAAMSATPYIGNERGLGERAQQVRAAEHNERAAGERHHCDAVDGRRVRGGFGGSWNVSGSAASSDAAAREAIASTTARQASMARRVRSMSVSRASDVDSPFMVAPVDLTNLAVSARATTRKA